MEKNTKLLLGAAVLGVGGYLYWKSKQQPKAQFLGLGKNKKKKMAGFGGTKTIFKPEPSKKIFAADGGSEIFKPESEKIFAPMKSKKVFKGADASNPLPQKFFKTAGSGWVRGFAGDGTINVQSSGWLRG